MPGYKVDFLLARCAKVRNTGTGTWVACCPAHDDKHPSMAVRELDDGRVLVHCFAGCSTEQILGALGLSFDALFPDSVKGDGTLPMHRPFPAADVLASLSNELDIIWIIAGDMQRKREISDADMDRLNLARRRFEAGMPYALGLHIRSTARNAKRG